MTRDDIKDAIDAFFEAVEGRCEPEERHSKLRMALDRLALATHFVDFTFDGTDYPEAPKCEYNTKRQLISNAFPDLGYYNVASKISVKIGDSAADVGDAIDDICDIASDLEEVLWYWKNTSVDDALWHLDNSFTYHWGMHLRSLQLYLYAKDFGW